MCMIRLPNKTVAKQLIVAETNPTTRCHHTLPRQAMISGNDFQSYMGPGDKNLPNSEVTGYQPVSRIGEVVMNAFGKQTK